ncbi:MAG TPA: RluA family pseudouridine synthase [Spirochaetota bacterium]|nr:RluA family pseudouridine synthase [Spirochaetota bacterium]
MNPDKIPAIIIYEDNHIIVADKPAGILSQGDISGETSLLDMLKNYVKLKYSKPGEAFIGLVHRLDKHVSGLMVFARTSKAASRLHDEITSGKMEKYYIALAEKEIVPDQDWHMIENYLYREKDKTFIAAKEGKNTQRGVLYYTAIASGRGKSLLLVKLETGRKHQIRAQLTGMGAPVYGDARYGSSASTGKAICLHSVFLGFVHPVKKTPVEFFSPPPELFRQSADFIPGDLQAELMERIRQFRIRP